MALPSQRHGLGSFRSFRRWGASAHARLDQAERPGREVPQASDGCFKPEAPTGAGERA
jgi:hypothetical protein